MKNKVYSDLIRIDRYIDRFNYLSIGGGVGEQTFGWERHLNQDFYRSKEWKSIRNSVIVRDDGMDMAFPGRPIFGKILVHHITPITSEDIYHGSDLLYDLENLVCVSHKTHNAIHYGDASLLAKPMKERRPGDTKLW